MTFTNYEFHASYNKIENDIAREFYLPCMREAVRYDRISGYFGSTIYIIAWDALKEFIKNQGKMRIVCSPFLTETDLEALSEGYSARNDDILAKAIEKEVQMLFENSYISATSRLLAYLVTKEIIDIKIAVPSGNESSVAQRMFHDKVGIFYDINGNAVGFRGSMNETFKGLSSDGNIESIDVFPSWLDSRDKSRVEEAEDFFEKLWSQFIPGINVYQFPSAAKEILKQKAEGVKWEELLDEVMAAENTSEKWKPNHKKDGKTPREHQINALEAWVKNGRRGIFEHATGSGKTFTAMCAINDSLKKGEVVIVLVPSRDLLNQWYKELRETLTDEDISYLLCGDNNLLWKKNNALRAWTSKTNDKRRIIIATIDTASSDDFIKMVTQGEHLFIVADEMHRIGSTERRKVLTINSGARLGLSATPRRYGDPEGTKILFDYFGGIIPPPFTLNDAIRSGVLTRYFYYPQKIQLLPEEQEDWNKITKKIQKIIAGMHVPEGSKIDISCNTMLQRLLINRARIVKNAKGKIELALRLLKEKYNPGEKWIVYCDNITQLNAVLKGALGLNINAYEYYADMPGDRETTLKYFSDVGGVLISIKCLDEGIDIPSTTHALILASSQNPREFIQRRGRILRKAPGKYFAYLYDAITVPFINNIECDEGLSIIITELSRAIKFGESAENPACIADLKNIALAYNIDFNTLSINGGIEDDEE